MKKSLLIAPLALALFSCANDKEVNAPDSGVTGEFETSYLSVSIVSNSNQGGRAGVDDEVQNDKTNGDFIFGSAAEHEVKSVRFYFFDVNGNGAKVRRDGKSYYDVPQEQIKGSLTSTPNVERILDATVVLESPAGDQVPASMVAIINIPAASFPTTSDWEAPSLNTLNAYVTDFISTTNGFVMSNTVYANTTTDMKFEETPLTTDNIKSSADDAKLSPVQIFVERVLAKVSFDTDPMLGELLAGTTNVFKVYDKTNENQLKIRDNGNAEGATDIAVYAKILGWNVTTAAQKSYLMKNIDPTWDVFEGWSFAPYYRSYWAKNPNLLTSDFKYTDFNGTSVNNAYPSGIAIQGISYLKSKENEDVPGIPNWTYVQENATLSNTANTGTNYAGLTVNNYKTQVIIPVQLMDDQQRPLNIIEFMGFKYLGASAETNVKLAIANLCNVFAKITTSGSTQYKSIESYIKLVSAQDYWENYNEGTQNDPNYYVYAVIDATDLEGQDYKWVTKNGSGATEAYTELGGGSTGKTNDEAFQDILDGLQPIKVWTSGYSYYYVDLKHLNTGNGKTGSDVGYYGVVRNHWYDVEVSKIYGLGTPVFDPKEEIIPETPNEVVNYVASKINILSWRLVHQSTTLGQ